MGSDALLYERGLIAKNKQNQSKWIDNIDIVDIIDLTYSLRGHIMKKKSSHEKIDAWAKQAFDFSNKKRVAEIKAVFVQQRTSGVLDKIPDLSK